MAVGTIHSGYINNHNGATVLNAGGKPNSISFDRPRESDKVWRLRGFTPPTQNCVFWLNPDSGRYDDLVPAGEAGILTSEVSPRDFTFPSAILIYENNGRVNFHADANELDIDFNCTLTNYTHFIVFTSPNQNSTWSINYNMVYTAPDNSINTTTVTLTDTYYFLRQNTLNALPQDTVNHPRDCVVVFTPKCIVVNGFCERNLDDHILYLYGDDRYKSPKNFSGFNCSNSQNKGATEALPTYGIGDILLYDRTMSYIEILTMSQFLMNKWVIQQ